MSEPCAKPLDPAELVDYWFRETEGSRDAAVEEHLLGCETCSQRLGELAALGEGVRRLAHEGAIEVVVTSAFLEMAAREGLRTREYRVPPGGRVQCTVTPEDDLLVARLQGDFKGISRLDVVAEVEGQPPHRIPDVPIHADSTELIVAQAMPAMRALGRSLLRLRLLAREAGGERLLGEYSFDHTPTRR